MDGELQLAIEGRLQLLLDGVLAELHELRTTTDAVNNPDRQWLLGKAQAYRIAIRQVQVAFREAGE
jgi:hypothetical protein